jgi:hypothetical protein
MTLEQEKMEKIAQMGHKEMARLWRFAPGGHEYFKKPYFEVFKKRFQELGGMTPQLSKKMGWGNDE